jgi:hypothetical protein
MTSEEQALALTLAKYIISSAPVWPAVSAAAATGNAGQENLFRPVTLGVKDHGSDGLWQWRLDRLTGVNGLQPWCARMGYDWRLMESQVLFMKWEMQNFYADLWAQMTGPGSRTLENLTANFMDRYEVPAPAYAALDKRIMYATQVYVLLAPVTPVPAAPAAPVPLPIVLVPAPTTSTADTLSALMAALKADQAKYKTAQEAVITAQANLAAIKQQLAVDVQKVTAATKEIQDQLDQTQEMTK